MASTVAAAGRPGWEVLASRRLWIAGLMGFAGGLPLLLTLTLLQAWLSAVQVSLTTIGFLGLVALPYNLKFLWAPLLDRFVPLGLGRRRGWLVIAQASLAASIAVLGLQDPATRLWAVGLAAVVVAFFSATQDVVIDAYRRESLADAEQGLGASMYTYGYRLGMLVVSAGGLVMADRVGFRAVYFGMAAIMFAMVAVTLLAPEPVGSRERPTTLRSAFLGPFSEFFRRREGLPSGALTVLAFILLYKLGDNLADHMTIPFYLELGFSNTEIGYRRRVLRLVAAHARRLRRRRAEPPRGPLRGADRVRGAAGRIDGGVRGARPRGVRPRLARGGSSRSRTSRRGWVRPPSSRSWRSSRTGASRRRSSQCSRHSPRSPASC